jgi:hypothetical protein
MREPWLFWGSLAVVPFGIACFVIAMRVASERLTRALEIAGELIVGVALPLAGYEGGFRYPAKDIWELKAQTVLDGASGAGDSGSCRITHIKNRGWLPQRIACDFSKLSGGLSREIQAFFMIDDFYRTVCGTGS